MALDKDQLKHHKKKRHLVVGGVTLPVSNFWIGGSLIGGGLTMATQGEEANESSEHESGETSATTSGSAVAGGDASAGGGAGSAM